MYRDVDCTFCNKEKKIEHHPNVYQEGPGEINDPIVTVMEG